MTAAEPAAHNKRPDQERSVDQDLIDQGLVHAAQSRLTPLGEPTLSRSQWVLKSALSIADALGVIVAIALASVFTSGWAAAPAVCFLGFNAVWAASRRLYRARFLTRRADELRRMLQAVWLASASTVVASFLFGFDLERPWLIVASVLASVFVAAIRTVRRSRFERIRKSGRMLRSAVLVGINDEADGFADMFLADSSLGYTIQAQVDPTRAETPRKLTTQVLRTVREVDASTVLIASTAVDMRSLNRLTRDLVDAGVHVELSSSLADIAPSRLTMRPLGRFPVMYLEPVRRNGWRAKAKRTFDVMASATALVVLSPVLISAAAIVKATSSGPMFFRQSRVGQDAVLFDVLKFRTMVDDAEELLTQLADQNEASGPLFKMKNDPRITRIGSFLRRTSIDEIPQLINVIRGEMSLVGPRPALPAEMAGWDADLYGRLRVKPGITGMWQVSGRSETTFEEYTRLDLYYVDNWSLLIDLGILIKTVPAVMKSDGAY